MNCAFDPYEQWLGIPPGPRPPDYYRLLGVTPFEENAQRLHEQTMQRMSQVRRYQMGPQSEHALRLAHEISRAFDVLNDPARKAAYDSQLRSAATIADVQQQHCPAPSSETPSARVQRLPAAAAEAVSPAEIETVVAEPEPPPVQIPVTHAASPGTLPRRSRRSADPKEANLLLARYVPWLGGGVIAVVVLAIIFQLVGGRGALQVQFSGLTPQTVVRLDGEPVDPQRLARGQSLSMGMHKLEASGPEIESFVREFAVHRGQTTDFQVMLTHLPEAPARVAPPPAAKPPGPTALPSASPSTASLLGSTWIGNDVYPNTSFTFESGGVLSWSHENGAYRQGTWRQIGSSLYFEQNDKFREFRGTILPDQITGSSTNVQGKRWTLTLRRGSLTSPQMAHAGQPPPSLLEDTTWSGLDNSDSKTFRFERGGILSYIAGSQNYRNGTWKQTGNVIYFETNKQYREFRGVMQGDLIEGDSWNVQGMKWKTSIRRQ